MLIVSLLIAFALGYGVREIISRRRRRKYRQQDRQDAGGLNAIEREVLRSNEGTRADASQPTKAVISSPEPLEHDG
jgi:hypothetical protein